MITVENVNKSFYDRPVLKDIDTVFDEGKTNLIIGQSGSGKTVLLKCIVGLYLADSGEICYHNRNMLSMKMKDRNKLRQEMGMLFQGSALFDSQTVLENIKFPLDMFTNDTEKEKRKRVDFCLNRVNLPEAHKLYPSELSGGMQKRVAIARAMVLNPKYLFCDEPNSGLDPKTALVIDKLISEITKEFKMTTVINTHDMNSVMEIGEKIVFIYQGRKCWEGNKDQVLNSGNESLEKFIFASDFAQKIKKNM